MNTKNLVITLFVAFGIFAVAALVFISKDNHFQKYEAGKDANDIIDTLD